MDCSVKSFAEEYSHTNTGKELIRLISQMLNLVENK
jgi:hypothetical protein